MEVSGDQNVLRFYVVMGHPVCFIVLFSDAFVKMTNCFAYLFVDAADERRTKRNVLVHVTEAPKWVVLHNDSFFSVQLDYFEYLYDELAALLRPLVHLDLMLKAVTTELVAFMYPRPIF